MQPHIALNWIGIALAIVAAFFLGFLWYGPLFGKTWAKLMGMKIDGSECTGKPMLKAMALQILGLFLTTYVLAHSNQVWRASVWGVGADQADYVYGFYGGFFTWVGFYVPMQLGKVSWEGRPWKLFFLNTSYDFLALQLISQILAHIR